MDKEKKPIILRSPIWVTKSGMRIPVDELDDNHFVCNIRYL